MLPTCYLELSVNLSVVCIWGWGCSVHLFNFLEESTFILFFRSQTFYRKALHLVNPPVDVLIGLIKHQGPISPRACPHRPQLELG